VREHYTVHSWPPRHLVAPLPLLRADESACAIRPMPMRRCSLCTALEDGGPGNRKGPLAWRRLSRLNRPGTMSRHAPVYSAPARSPQPSYQRYQMREGSCCSWPVSHVSHYVPEALYKDGWLTLLVCEIQASAQAFAPRGTARPAIYTLSDICRDTATRGWRPRTCVRLDAM